MARPLRIEFPGAIYHVTSRGNARRKIFLDDSDRETFLSTLAWVVERFGWICHAYCLMDNHFHLMIETPEPNLSRGMRQLNGVYTQGFNRRHRKVGHLFQGRFKAILVERDSYLLELARYVVLNPVRAKLVKAPEDYLWSSYRPTLGLDSVPNGLTIDWLLGQFAKTKPAARQRYAAFVQAGIGRRSPWADLKGQVLLGGETFVEKMAPHLKASEAVAEIPKRQRRVHQPSLKKLFAGADSKATRDQAMVRAFLEYGYTLSEIGREAGLHYATVSRIVKAGEGM
ncbi:MAG: transposase [Hydrogenophilales bacterium]|nr:transposase [Hydrogenophilales bacterium]